MLTSHSTGRHRWVDMKQHDYHASQVPPEWHSWIHHIRQDPPNKDAFYKTNPRPVWVGVCAHPIACPAFPHTLNLTSDMSRTSRVPVAHTSHTTLLLPRCMPGSLRSARANRLSALCIHSLNSLLSSRYNNTSTCSAIASALVSPGLSMPRSVIMGPSLVLSVPLA